MVDRNVPPVDDEKFDLIVDGDTDLGEVVKLGGFKDGKRWRILGSTLTLAQERKIRIYKEGVLKHLGDVRNLADAKEKADNLDFRLLGGQALLSFKKKYPQPDNNRDPVIFGDYEWQSPGGVVCVPFLGSADRHEWYVGFSRSDCNFLKICRWALIPKS